MQKLQYQSTAEQNQHLSKTKLGKLKVFIKNKYIFITIGPDYYFFLPAFAFFLITAIFIINIVKSTSQNPIFRGITFFICLFQPFAYLYTALSNPGVVLESPSEINFDSVSDNQTINKNFKLCKKCNMHVKKSTFHCKQCQVCIQEYDHHCPWVSKCIGKKNLVAFYIFLASTPIFIIYSIIAFFVCASLSLVKNSQQN